MFTSTDDLRFINDFSKRISNPTNQTSDSCSKQAIQKYDSKITDNKWRLTQMDETMQNISSKSAQLAAQCKLIARKTTNQHDYAQMPPWRQIGSDKQRNSIEIAIYGTYPCTRRIMPESAKFSLSEKVGFRKAVKIPVFCYLQAQFRLISFSVDNYTQKHTQRLKTLKTSKTAVYKL